MTYDRATHHSLILKLHRNRYGIWSLQTGKWHVRPFTHLRADAHARLRNERVRLTAKAEKVRDSAGWRASVILRIVLVVATLLATYLYLVTASSACDEGPSRHIEPDGTVVEDSWPTPCVQEVYVPMPAYQPQPWQPVYQPTVQYPSRPVGQFCTNLGGGITSCTIQYGW